MAGFRIGRGRNSRNAQQGPYPPHGQAPEPGPGPGAYGQGQHQGPASGGRGGQTWHAGGGGGRGEPEYFGEPQRGGYGYPGGGPQSGHPGDSRSRADNPGHTRAFSIHDPSPYGHDGGPGDGHGYDSGYSDGSVHSAGHAPPAGPRLHWKELLQGIVLRPNATFYQMRDYPVWGPALTVTFVYGLLAVFGLDETRESVIDATLGTALQYVAGTGIAMVIMGLMLGAVTHTLARQFGGNGMWAPTIGLSMLIMSLSDAPRLVLAMFMGGTATAVQVVGWITWIAAGALFTSMVSRSHDLPWPRALGASAIQLIALLALVKLGTL
ncbi:YIP1 family protein [Streptomyces sp. DSM 42041]|uniref:YIP1 family protein n=1 Tax=Streptomyces hazeniae TaxID=3075538 RepID=A0ABU2NT37_9ACTN|nr:YIP1 family protein [Streptomyces sp. DSM 42041]MDT0380156.1 YIP1 family protein [Streptomyces sp. DSM 42041]